MTMLFDILILGSGPAATRIAEQCAEKYQVAVIDSQEIGGTCALHGCNPKKVLVHAAELVDWTHRSKGQLIDNNSHTSIDWSQLIAFKETFTNPVTPQKTKKFKKKNISIFQGDARFTGLKTIEVEGAELEGEKIVICTGARPTPLKISGEDLITHSDQFLQTSRLPAELIFIGGGYISFEFAHAAQRAGAAVTIMEHNERPLSGFEPSLVERLGDYSRTLGIEIVLSSNAQSLIKNKDKKLQLTAIQKGIQKEYYADMVVHGAGRVPATEGLELERAAIEYDEKGIKVNQFMQSISNSHVYAAGDVVDTDQPKLTPVANQQGYTVVKNIIEGNYATPDYGVVPRVLFTVPQLASVGMDEDQASEAGYNFKVQTDDMSSWGSLRKVGVTCAAYKILIDRQTDQVLGAHLLAPDAAETINLFALGMKFRLTTTDLKSVLFAFPTSASDIRNMI
ncbi:dihydrolipoyl dehydrogenase family protein [Gimesia algae]|uniref:Dihydrolipoyl dehydrogenase n=1 Tax=Gimesia algae TaxID=2527971 RepID=A0A517VHP5_9PLAN|nr:NAD(P)/FAD-dependent oxidoreductase [Gimesia algae]QDT92525.1 Dihydrolipoyl dehydrogenase [Gimesia algae]